MGKSFEDTDFLFGANSVFVEELYQKYMQDPASVDASWAEFFQNNEGASKSKSTSNIIGAKAAGQVAKKSGKSEPSSGASSTENSLHAKFMIDAFRRSGHFLAELDPLGLEQKKTESDLNLNLEDFGFTAEQLNAEIDISNEFAGVSKCTLSELYDILHKTYSSSVAAEFSHVESSAEQEWLYNALENANIHSSFSEQEQKKMLSDLVEVEGFEQYIHTKFPGAKRFSIEGGDAAILCLDKMIELSADNDVKEIVLGLAHRGRLSTLTKVMQKPYRAVLAEFTGKSSFPEDLGVAGDVKYHMGYSSDRVYNDKKIHLSLTPNPSHLEAVNPVVAGKVRCKQDYHNSDRNSVAGLIVHGDAAFCGQGVVAESLVMSGLSPYEVGGIFHLVINNQIGFTANSSDGRPGRYCTEVAKMVGAPILHVNGDDIEAVMMVVKIASDYRMKFGKDVVVDLVCYRKYGHNEGDEPMYTQAPMYSVIKQKQTPAAVYAQKLQQKNIIDASYYGKLKEQFKEFLNKEYDQVSDFKPEAQWLQGKWSGMKRSGKSVKTGIEAKELQKMCKTLCTVPESFNMNKKLKKLLDNRIDSVCNKGEIDWASAEQLAFASLLDEGVNIRLTGQDAGRGTFSHRHSVIHSQDSWDKYLPLNNISNKQGFYEVADSNLSEYAALGFEYGYSLVNPNNLVIWEAQFGDFSNGAQIMFDQFISSAETKWLRMSGLVCLLPHGMEGQGPEHSSARLERYLQLCADDNMQVVYPTTPYSIFHVLRRQMKQKFRKPLIVMSPKSLLRHKLVTSDISEIDKNTRFKEVIGEIDNINNSKVEKIVFCSGKIYYDLLEERRAQNIENIALIRVEQLYPFAENEIIAIIKQYKNAKQFVWCQEEPKNMGPWRYIRARLDLALEKAGVKNSISPIAREEAASPAVGSLALHNRQQKDLVAEALKIKTIK